MSHDHESITRLVKKCDTTALLACLRDPIRATNSVQAERNKFVIAEIQAELARREVAQYTWTDIEEALRARGSREFTFDGITGIVQSVERESGNGQCFNVYIKTKHGVLQCAHVTTRD